MQQTSTPAPAATAVIGLWGRGDGPIDLTWTLSQTPHVFTLLDRRGTLTIPAAQARRITVTRRWWRTQVVLADDPHPGRRRLLGLTGREGRALGAALELAHQRAALDAELDAAVAWAAQVEATMHDAGG